MVERMGLDGSTAPARSPRTELPLLLAAALALLMGIQLLRVFLPLATFYLHDAGRLSPLATGGISLVVLALGLRAPMLVEQMGWRRTVRWIAGLLALTRIVEQISTSPAVDFRIALIGSALLALLLPLLLLAATRSAALRVRLAFLVLMALALETALRTLGGTLDLSWQQPPAADLTVLVSAAACLAGVALAGRLGGAQPPAAAGPWGWSALGAWLALYLLVFSNPAHLAARAGMPLERASWFVLGSWLIAVLLLGVLPLHAASRWRTAEAAALAAAGSWIAVFGGDSAWFGILIGTPGMSVLLFDLLAGRPAGKSRRLAPGAAGMVLLILLYLIYGRFDQSFGPPEPIVYLAAIGLLLASRLLPAWRAQAESPPAFWRLWLGGLTIAAVVAAT
ncbi:MAG: hypothetical protein ACE5EG_05080, partial [Thermoanaerobaculia bacterium]